MARFASSDDGDKSAPVWIVAFLTLSYTTLTLLLRLWIKLRMIGLDDGLAAVAQLLAYGSIGSLMWALRHGLAKAFRGPTDEYLIELAKALQAGQIFYILTLAAAKATMVLFLHRVFERANQHRAILLCRAAIALAAFWGVGATIATSVACTPDSIWVLGQAQSCTGAATLWLLVTVFDCASELLVVALAAYLLSALQMKTGDKNAAFVAFVWRIGLVVLASLHYRSYHGMLYSDHVNTAASRVMIWEQVGICYSLMSVTWPFSKQWIKSFDTSTLAMVSALDSSGPYGRSVFAARSKSQQASGNVTLSRRSWREREGHLNAVYGASMTGDNGSSGSQELIIRREDEVAVTYEDR